MKPLTIEHINNNNLNEIDLVRYFKPEWSDKECDYFLWEHTCYPFDIHKTIQQLNDKLLK